MLYPDEIHSEEPSASPAKSAIVEDNSPTLAHKVVYGDLDFALVTLPAPLTGLATHPIVQYRMRVNSAGKATDTGGPTTLRAFKGRHLLLMPSTFTPWVRQYYTQRALDAGLLRVTQLEFPAFTTIESRLRRTGEDLFGFSAPDIPFNEVLARTTLDSVEPEDDELVVQLGGIWRSLDTLNEGRVRFTLQHMNPTGEIERI